jgi:general stress protein 26
MTTPSTEKLQDLLHDFRTAMLVPRTTDGKLRSRPMAVAEMQAEGVLWFITQRSSNKLDEIARDDHVNVAMQSTAKFLSISGTATAVDDRAKIAELWSETWKVWFPGGKDDPSLLLLKVQVQEGEYWDDSGVQGLKYLFEAGKAYLSGTRPDVASDANMHGKVILSK